MNAGKKTAEQGLRQLNASVGLNQTIQFIERKRQQCQERRSARQGLSHVAHESKLLTARQYETTRLRVSVDNFLQIRRDRWSLLYFVKNRSA